MTTGDATRMRLAELLEEKGITKYRLSCDSAVSPTTHKNILNGKSKNSLSSTVTLLCAGLGVTLREFYDSSLFDDLSMADEDAIARDRV